MRKNRKEEEQTLAEFRSAHRRSQAKRQLVLYNAANDPQTGNDPQIGSQMIPRLDRK